MDDNNDDYNSNYDYDHDCPAWSLEDDCIKGFIDERYDSEERAEAAKCLEALRREEMAEFRAARARIEVLTRLSRSRLDELM